MSAPPTPAADAERHHPRPRAVLVGPMASGKSSVGRSLAARWGVELRDSDALIVERLGCSISDYFATHGEAAFREVERDVITEQLGTFDGVLALGGGAVLDDSTRAALREHTVVYLTVDERNAGYRIRGDVTRPILANGGIDTWRRIFAERRRLYEEVATVTVDTSRGTTGASATRIIEALVAAEHETPVSTGGKRPLPSSVAATIARRRILGATRGGRTRRDEGETP
ncbi:shikimate kinase [Dermacoccus nishinomiyaensis]|uniref:shikimate kinase n=1 Tax=Dermacoccus TaxID=57495 RepID=UPI0010428D19|nr:MULTISPECIES: shikimate kinase [Dermacoccus]MCT1603309.1 shikimate kinase [Dermacoccus nishinomiyaensis]TCJ91859.1 shikimate kinase [Dermacoccus sp. SAI-028]